MSSQSESWARVGKKFKHGKGKAKWKKYHPGEGDEFGEEASQGNDDGRSQVYDQDD